MSHLLFFQIALFLNIWAGNGHAARQDPPAGTTAAQGEWVARQVDARDTGRDARIAMRMRLYDRQNRLRERALTVFSLAGGGGRPTPGDRTLVRFTHPPEFPAQGFSSGSCRAPTMSGFLFASARSRPSHRWV